MILERIKTAVITISLICTTWLVWQNNSLKGENSRLSENSGQLIGNSEQLSLSFTKQELNSYLEARDSALLKRLGKEGINLSKVEKLTSVNHYYQDTVKKSFDVSPIIEAINKKEPLSIKWSDTTKCLPVSGDASYNGKTLTVNVTSKEYKTKTDAVWYQDRKQWEFWFIKSKFLGKRIVSGKVFDECGKSKIVEITKAK